MSLIENVLIIITARGGSKGIPNKNIKLLNNKPLIQYTIEAAREVVKDENICLSTDSTEIVEVARQLGLEVPFVRPSYLATDSANSYDTILHAVNYYESIGKYFETIILLQPTSPFRKGFHIQEAFQLYNNKIDMVVSVVESKANPYFNLWEESSEGMLRKVKEGNYIRRQDCPSCFLFNGAIYIINTDSLKRCDINKFSNIIKYTMDQKYSVDIDTKLDWEWSEFLIQTGVL